MSSTPLPSRRTTMRIDILKKPTSRRGLVLRRSKLRRTWGEQPQSRCARFGMFTLLSAHGWKPPFWKIARAPVNLPGQALTLFKKLRAMTHHFASGGGGRDEYPIVPRTISSRHVFHPRSRKKARVARILFRLFSRHMLL